jgi:SAM-dependent methyltransferase
MRFANLFLTDKMEHNFCAKFTPMQETFEQSVREYLRQYKDDFNFENLVNNHLDISRFYPWAAQVEAYHKLQGAVVLSSGSGSAGDLYAFVERGIARGCGVEVDEGLTELARKRFEYSPYKDKVDLVTYDGRVLPILDNTFDIAISFHVIEHTLDVGLYLAEIVRVMKPGGVLFLDVPNRYFPVEQHSNIPYIHYVPRKLRDRLIRLMLSPSWPFVRSPDMRFRLTTHLNYHIPSPAKLVEFARTHRPNGSDLIIRDAYFHSYSESMLAFRSRRLPYAFGSQRRMTTFRLILEKGSLGAPSFSPGM